MRADIDRTSFRLRSARGHLEAVARMVDEDRYCIDVLHQLSAVQGALDGIKRDITAAHLEGCLPQAVTDGRVEEIAQELMSVLFGSAPRYRSERRDCHTSVPKAEAACDDESLHHAGAGI